MPSTITIRATLVDPNNEVKCLDLSSTFVERQKLIESLSDGYVSTTMKLFVSLSAIITVDDYQHLGPLIWEYCLEPNAGSLSAASVSPFVQLFLLTD